MRGKARLAAIAEACRVRSVSLRRELVAFRSAVSRSRAEILAGAGLIVGWLLVTYTVSGLLPPRLVWPASIGLLLLSSCGWSLFVTIATKGLYVLHREAKRRG